ncbi:MAG: hypothetical protein C0507_18220 [Cyanobacteria bacterium PR.3.49]|nr:hypothetical protein [Cyanobacteria bacterium PR.3.49]
MFTQVQSKQAWARKPACSKNPIQTYQAIDQAFVAGYLFQNGKGLQRVSFRIRKFLQFQLVPG